MDKHKRKDNSFLGDVGDMTKSAFAAAAAMKRDLVRFVRQNVESMVKKMNFVQREEFNEVKKNTMHTIKELEKIMSTSGTTQPSHTAQHNHNKGKSMKKATKSKSTASKKKAPAKKTTAKKTVAKKKPAAKKATAKKTTAKKSTAKKSPAKKTVKKAVKKVSFGKK